MTQRESSSSELLAARTVAAATVASSNALRAGSRVPAFLLPDVDGRLVPVERVLHNGPLVLWFLRGLWCSYTGQSLRDISETFEHIKLSGASALIVQPDAPIGSLKSAPGVPQIGDPGLKLMREFGLTFDLPLPLQEPYRAMGYEPPRLRSRKGSRFLVPIPATYLIDQSGVVVFTQIDVDYRNYVDSNSLLTALHGLQKQQKAR